MKFTKIEDQRMGETLYRAKHPTGVEVFVLPKKGYRQADAMFATKFGSIDSEFEVAGSGKTVALPDGTAHFLEHKMFEEPDGNVFDKFSLLGANANAFTSFGVTSYLFSATDHFYENLEVLLKFVQNPYFTKENVEKEQGIIGQEIRMYEDNPQTRVLYNLLGCLYQKCAVKKDIAGTVESIAEIDKDVLYDAYNTFYHPSNMFLFVAGDLDVQRVGECVEKSLRDIAPLEGEIKRIFEEEPAEIVKDYAEQKLSVSIPLFMLGFKDTDGQKDGIELLKKDIETRILLEVLFGKGSALYAKLYEEGLINDTFMTDYSCHKRYAVSTIEGESKDPRRLRDLVLQAVDDFALTEEEYQRVKNVIWGRAVRSFDSTEEIAQQFVLWYVSGVNYLDFSRAYSEVTYEGCKQRLSGHFHRKNAALSVIEPIQ